MGARVADGGRDIGPGRLPCLGQGSCQGTVLLAKEDAGPKDKGQATSIKADLKQAGDSLTGSLIVGGNPRARSRKISSGSRARK